VSEVDFPLIVREECDACDMLIVQTEGRLVSKDGRMQFLCEPCIAQVPRLLPGPVSPRPPEEPRPHGPRPRIMTPRFKALLKDLISKGATGREAWEELKKEGYQGSEIYVHILAGKIRKGVLANRVRPNT
jgi:hypothetical protein